MYLKQKYRAYDVLRFSCNSQKLSNFYPIHGAHKESKTSRNFKLKGVA